MKKIFITTILFILIFIVPTPSQCAINTQNAQISKIENELYGFDYTKDSVEKRLSRLEETVYGKSSNGSVNNRLKKLATDINADLIGLEIEPTEDTFKTDEPIADSTVNYPIVDEIEMKLFNQTYKNRDFHTRIVTIERKLFGKIYDVEDYSTRMDRIKSEVMPERLAQEKVFGYDKGDLDYALNSKDLSGINSSRYSGMMPYGQENYSRPYANYGDMTGGAMPIPENLEDELAQLEYNTFGTEFSNEDPQTRIKRLNSVNKAQKSSQRYDSNKFQQRMSTVMEIGAMLLMILAMVL